MKKYFVPKLAAELTIEAQMPMLYRELPSTFAPFFFD